ncbi:MAG: beta-propeller domain-containing protein [Planctomycetaceae bacterium]
MTSQRRSRKSSAWIPSVAEVLEDRRLLSATTGLTGQPTSKIPPGPVDAELTQWRQQVEAQIIAQADALYGDQYGNQTEGFVNYWRGLPIAEDAVPFALADTASDTNTQVAGVDEGDIVETDGTFIYTISGKEIVIVRAAVEDQAATVVSRIELAETPVAMLLNEDRLTVVSQEYGYVPWLAWQSSAITSSLRTVVTVLDVSDRTSPMLTQETIVDGQFQSARAIGDQVYVVVNNNDGIPYVPELNTIYDETVESNFRFQTRDEYLQTIAELVHGNGTEYNSGLTPPSVYRRGDDGSGQVPLERLGWLDGADVVTPDGGQLTSVLQIDTTSTEVTPVSNLGVSTRRYSATQIYASATSLYLITEEYTLSSAASTVDFLPAPQTVDSRIQKIGLDTGKLVLEATGVVLGNVESQFSIDEHHGVLRIVTTTGNDWWWAQQSSANHLFVLQDVGDELVEVGSIRDLAAGERIYAARFDGDRGWMVTFRQVDPVFSLDLSDPTNPHVTGELKIPGYSDHLQLIGDNHLLAIGRDATEDGRVEEVQVSLFDVSDMNQPELLHRYSLNSEVWGHSEALQDHLAFNYLPDSQILAVPFGTWGQQGMVLLHVDVVAGISLAGQIDAQSRPVLGDLAFIWNQDNSYKRSVQIDNLLYAVSSASIAVVDLTDPDTVLQTLVLQDEQTRLWPVPELPVNPLPLEDAIRITEVLADDGTLNDLRVQLDRLLSDVLLNPDNVDEYEFRVLNPSTGEEILREVADQPDVALRNELGELLDAGTYNVQVRTKMNRLRNAQFGAWSAPETLSVLADQATMISQNVLQFGRRVLEWSRLADRVTMAPDGTTLSTNAVDHYEVWINDATTNQRVLLDRAVPEPQLALGLSTGDYFAWFRAIYEDGTQGNWSVRERFSVLGPKLSGVISPGVTANATPEISWTGLADATGFEVEVTSPDGSEMVYSVAELVSARHTITNALAAGTYSFRVRADLASGGQTEWSDPATFTVVGRPQLILDGSRLDLLAEHAQQIEVWVGSVSTNQRIFHDTNWQGTTIADAIAAFNLEDALPGQYNIWIRSTLPDGTRTAWSPKVSLNVGVADIVQVVPVSEFEVGADQVLTWLTAEGVESYEVFVRRVGETGALIQESGLQTLSYTFADHLDVGEYVYWVRGALVGGGFTKWGAAHRFAVTDAPMVTIVDGIAEWSASVFSVRHEVWVNRVDENRQLLEARVVHLTDFTGNSFDLNTLPDGHYSVWVRSLRDDVNGVVKSAWSRREDLSVARLTAAINNVADKVDDVIDDVLDALNLF